MAHFRGEVQGNRGKASRNGSKSSGLNVVAASWQGAVRTTLYHDEETGEDWAHVYLDRWHEAGVTRTLYRGPVGRNENHGL